MAKAIATRTSLRTQSRIWNACRHRSPGGNTTFRPTVAWRSESGSGWRRSANCVARVEVGRRQNKATERILREGTYPCWPGCFPYSVLGPVYCYFSSRTLRDLCEAYSLCMGARILLILSAALLCSGECVQVESPQFGRV